MSFKKMGILIIIITIALEFVMNIISFDKYLSIALGVFGVGSGVVLMFLDNYKHFDR